jgi:cold shock CspA family protein
MTNVRSNTKIGAIGAAILDAQTKTGVELPTIAQAPAKPKRKRLVTRKNRSGQKTVMRKGIGWEHSIAEISVTVDEGDCVVVQDDGPYSYSALQFDDRRPQQLNVRMTCQTDMSDLAVWSVQGGTHISRIDKGNLPHLHVPVTWGAGGVPQVRKAHEDNCDIILMDGLGRFVQLMVGITVRSGFQQGQKGPKWYKVYLNLQEQFTGQVVRTSVAKANQLGLDYVPNGNGAATVVPLWDYHAYPGQNWLGMNPANVFGAETIVPSAIAEGRSVQLSQASAEEWVMPEFGEPSNKDRERGVVQWFNVNWLGGAGKIITGDGELIHLHWTKLRDMYVPQPMQVVEFTRIKTDKGHQAGGVRAV